MVHPCGRQPPAPAQLAASQPASVHPASWTCHLLCTLQDCEGDSKCKVMPFIGNIARAKAGLAKLSKAATFAELKTAATAQQDAAKFQCVPAYMETCLAKADSTACAADPKCQVLAPFCATDYCKGSTDRCCGVPLAHCEDMAVGPLVSTGASPAALSSRARHARLGCQGTPCCGLHPPLSHACFSMGACGWVEQPSTRARACRTPPSAARSTAWQTSAPPARAWRSARPATPSARPSQRQRQRHQPVPWSPPTSAQPPAFAVPLPPPPAAPSARPAPTR